MKIHYNISHSEDFALVVFADAPVGCDIEKIKPFYEELASSFFNEKECEYIFNQKEKSTSYLVIYLHKTAKKKGMKEWHQMEE